MEINKIYNEDCLEGIQKIASASIDTIITDPPYFIGMTHNGKKGNYNDLIIMKPFFDSLFSEFSRVIKENGKVYIFCDWRTYAFYYPLLLKHISVRNMLVWDKISGPGSSYAFTHELILFAEKDTPYMKGSNIFRIPGFSAGAKKTNGEMLHPTQKPVEVIEKLITDSTKEGDLVLDCFMGSGTTAVAAKKLNRNFIGFEIQEKYITISENRLKQVEILPTFNF
ncbi:site-specific DNA-methyltransferase [Phocaeicola vulgatus]|jgi:site-specific DNA-methyltransferase (adenine-specific)|uniref:DNA-methyltransferase n=1 Tax=Phocaeicola vulgatus TaxID=821 RepID=UPI0011B4D66B|nr:site-specific DNA-methyltransferase [Phocaeicola vulgatus]TWV58251.1 site-specific DNA-methyltransferase [Phocaeicola dorei]MDB0741586.1 site-specific DNA-methyltransferase [Phocaeicola vulgatus]MDB0752464.1 site-specific DNA-methyltransferase [Phocaeicola vulgatus]MDB0764238.1 site-specific DNA-methyltransferase [Phocaeicola vulgatus]MDB0768762.1 site-specific DNA-methyltransferase [Phocaeicola vulgatus]